MQRRVWKTRTWNQRIVERGRGNDRDTYFAVRESATGRSCEHVKSLKEQNVKKIFFDLRNLKRIMMESIWKINMGVCYTKKESSEMEDFK